MNEASGLEIPDGMELYTMPDGRNMYVHSLAKCVGSACVIHRPMIGPWTIWPLHWRYDRGIFERICPHGVGHPAAEQLGYWRSIGEEWQSIHGCCGACRCGPRRVQVDG